MPKRRIKAECRGIKFTPTSSSESPKKCMGSKWSTSEGVYSIKGVPVVRAREVFKLDYVNQRDLAANSYWWFLKVENDSLYRKCRRNLEDRHGAVDRMGKKTVAKGKRIYRLCFK